MGKARKILAGILLGCISATPLVYAQTPEQQWQKATSLNGSFKAVISQPDIEVFSAPHIIMLRVNKEVDVRLFTILGKLVSAEHLEPGLFQFNMDSHGIYIIKTDKTSCKIAI